jgi:hypothetical protein
MDVNVKVNNISVAEAAKFAAASGMALSQGTTVKGTVDANIQATGAEDRPALTGGVTASNLEMSGKDVPQPVLIQSVNLNLSPSEIHSNPFRVGFGQYDRQHSIYGLGNPLLHCNIAGHL